MGHPPKKNIWPQIDLDSLMDTSQMLVVKDEKHLEDPSWHHKRYREKEY
jgi:hypothetical protein